jgi:hypothetical protein
MSKKKGEDEREDLKMVGEREDLTSWRKGDEVKSLQAP